MLFPAGVIPFTYVTSFMFVKDSFAQTFTIFLHFIFAGIGGIIAFILRTIESAEKIGDTLVWVLKIVPSFCLTNSVMYAASKELLFRVRENVPTQDFDI